MYKFRFRKRWDIALVYICWLLWEMATEFEYGMSKRGQRTVICISFEYWNHKTYTVGQTIWKCCKYQTCKCSATLNIFEVWIVQVWIVQVWTVLGMNRPRYEPSRYEPSGYESSGMKRPGMKRPDTHLCGCLNQLWAHIFKAKKFFHLWNTICSQL